jgi:hypothetical protein
MLDDAIKAFEKTQQKYKQFGAYDTEPDGIFQQLLLHALEGKQPDPPRSGAKWELYAASMNCEEAAEALNSAAIRVIRLIENAPIKHYDEIKRYIDKYCWRFR